MKAWIQPQSLDEDGEWYNICMIGVDSFEVHIDDIVKLFSADDVRCIRSLPNKNSLQIRVTKCEVIDIK